MTIASVQVLTPAGAANQINSHGLDPLGLTVPTLSMRWSNTATPSDADANTLRMSLSDILAPFGGTYEVLASPLRWSGPTGAPITEAAGVLSMHPEAIHRLESLVKARIGSLDRPVPVAMLIYGDTPPAQPLLAMFRAGDAMPHSGDVTFHDRRGLIIDPVAVASLFADLLSWRPGLSVPTYAAATASGIGGVGAIANLAGSVATRVHVVSLHGAAYTSRRTGSEMQVLDSSGTATGASLPASGIVDLASGQKLGRPAPSAGAAPLQVLWGNSPGGKLDTTPWVPPTPTATPAPSLPRQFFRVVAADLDWHLLGNRGYVTGNSTFPAEDDWPAPAPLPQVRRSLAGFSFLLDGSDVSGAMGAAVAAWPSAGDNIGFLCSPQIDTTFALPSAPGTPAHWPEPGMPTPPTGADTALSQYDPTAVNTPATAPTATWRTVVGGAPGALPSDVIVTFPANALPAGTHVRVYSRLFQVIDQIAADPSFLRGDGGSAIVQAGAPTSVLLINPFGFGTAIPTPQPTEVTVDFVLMSQSGRRRMHSMIHLPLGSPQPWTDNTATFGGSVSPRVAMLATTPGNSSVAPSSVFGIPQTAPSTSPPGAGASLAQWTRWLANESATPRIGPHLPTQGRFETVLAVGAVTSAATTYAFTSVLSGGRYAWETRCASPELGNPGNPAGPDLHATGISVQGQLAYDLAFHALKRSQPILPTGSGAPGWFLQSAGNNWNVPAADPDPGSGSCMAGAMLETVAAITDSPELAVVPMPTESDTVQSAINAVADALGVSRPTFTAGNETRLRHQLQREIATAQRGQRDAMWSLARAVTEAREYVFIESATFVHTATSSDAHLVDLTALLTTALTNNHRLKVMISVPRLPDFTSTKPTWVRRALRDRRDAILGLQAVDSDRVAAFHPIGFPGRSVVGRSTVVLVDDVYALVGTSHWRRRGMTFDGGCDVVSTDRRLDDRGASAGVASFRQALLADRLGIGQPANAAAATALWTRLADPDSTFTLISELLLAGGLGRCTPIYAGPPDSDTHVIPESTDKVDPNGLAGLSLTTLLGGLAP